MIIKEYSTDLNLYEIFRCLHKEYYAVFLDSSSKSKYSNFSIAGFIPSTILEDKDDVFYLNKEPKDCDCIEWFKNYLNENYEPNNTNLPFISGGIGYISYDYGKKFMNLPHIHDKYIDMPDFRWVFYDLYLIEDIENNKIYISAKNEEAVRWFYDKEKETENWKYDNKPGDKNSSININSDFCEADYSMALKKMIDYIVNGDIYITNMTRQIELDAPWKNPFEIFDIVRNINPSPFGGYFNYPDIQIISASPERFFEIRDKKISTRPIKGTRKRGVTPEEDEAMRTELIESEKDKSELLMIVDLERNDLSRVCMPNSVKVEELFVIEAYATVFHLVSTISGKLKEKINVADVLEALFPGGSITGAPKHRSMEIIDELERSRRMLYTGSMGYIGFDGDCDLNIVIRTLVHQNGKYHLGAGGGITCESEPVFEFEETVQKAQALIDSVQKASDRRFL